MDAKRKKDFMKMQSLEEFDSFREKYKNIKEDWDDEMKMHFDKIRIKEVKNRDSNTHYDIPKKI